MKKIAVVILHFNNKKNTLDCLTSVQALSRKDCELCVYVVDNGSKEAFNIKDGEQKVIRNEQNLGYAGGNNIGIRYALHQGADYILLLNNDTVVDKHLVEELLKVAESSVAIAIVVPKIYFAPGSEFHKDRYKKEEQGRVIWYAGGIMDWNNVIGHHRGVNEVDWGQFDKIEETAFATGNCILVKKDIFEKIGFLDERYFLYYEDGDFSMRAKRAGFVIMYVPKAKLWHKNAASAGGSGSALQDYYITRNRLLFGMWYAPLRAKLALIRESFILLVNGRVWQKRAVLDFYRGKLGKGSYPV